MTNSEARKRMQAQNPASLPASVDGSPAPASVDPATIPGPYAANLGDGANGRLSEAERAELIDAALLWFPTGEGFANPQAWAIQVADHAINHFERIVREHTDRALAEAWDKGWCAGRGRGPGHTDACPIGGGRHANPYRAARQERGR